jgi:HAD superfamily hydrolase (TIGR01549 family)
MLRWIFFDVGNVLLDEDLLTYENFCRHVAAIRGVRPDLTFLDLLAEREACAAGSRWPLHDVVSRYLDETAVAAVWDDAARDLAAAYAKLSPPVAGAAALLQRVVGRYRLGLIANQGTECRTHLAALRWLEHFEVVAFAAELGVFKPDRALFQSALRRAGVAPEQALMVGDRLDNDIAPAASLGMATAYVRWPRRAAKGWPVGEDAQVLAYLAALERASARAEAQCASIRPTFTVETIAELDAALDAAQC